MTDGPLSVFTSADDGPRLPMAEAARSLLARLRSGWAHLRAGQINPWRLAGYVASAIAIVIGVLMAWVFSAGEGTAYVLGVGAFVAGHIGLLATLTFTSAYPDPSGS